MSGMPRPRPVSPGRGRSGGRKPTSAYPPAEENQAAQADLQEPKPADDEQPSGAKQSEENENGKRPAQEEAVKAEVKMKRQKLAGGRFGVVVGPRIPYQYFVTKGFGDTDEGSGSDPYETGAYDMALEMAKIHQFNILQYTSVLPPESVEVPVANAEPHFMHGAVLETIMSVMHGTKGDRICAGIGRIHVQRKKDNFVVGGYAAEYKGHAKKEDAIKALQEDLRGIIARRYDTNEYESFGESFTVQEHEVKHNYGTVLAAICFTSYIMPEMS